MQKPSMKKPLGVAVTAASLFLLVIGFVAVNNAGAALNTYSATLAGTNEVPPSTNGYTGTASITVDTVTFQVCIQGSTNFPVDDPVEAAHIHEGAAGVNGPVVVDFNGLLNTCVTSTSTIVNNIVANPSGFYVNLHTDLFSSGAARGQLVLVPPSTSATLRGTGTSLGTSSTTTSSTAAANNAAVVATPRFTG